MKNTLLSLKHYGKLQSDMNKAAFKNNRRVHRRGGLKIMGVNPH
jgi:hypothetical protein